MPLTIDSSAFRPSNKTGYSFEEINFYNGDTWICATGKRFLHHWNEPQSHKFLMEKLVRLDQHEMGLRRGRFENYIPVVLDFPIFVPHVRKEYFQNIFKWMQENINEYWNWDLAYAEFVEDPAYPCFAVNYSFTSKNDALRFKITWI